jgi:hypothetical protein
VPSPEQTRSEPACSHSKTASKTASPPTNWKKAQHRPPSSSCFVDSAVAPRVPRPRSSWFEIVWFSRGGAPLQEVVHNLHSCSESQNVDLVRPPSFDSCRRYEPAAGARAISQGPVARSVIRTRSTTPLHSGS